MKKTGLFLMRAKGGPMIGMGHVFRTMAVAEAARIRFDLQVLFARNDDRAVAEALLKNSFEGFVLDDGPARARILGETLSRYAPDGRALCITDSKEDLSAEILLMKELGVPVLLLDNITPARFHADVNIYPAAHFDFRGLGWNGYTGECLGGRDWVPLAQRFLRVRPGLRPVEKREALLVTMGGSDPNRLALRVMDSLRAFRSDVPIRVVLGFSCRFAEEVQSKNRELGNRFTIIEQATNIEELMSDTGLAITALGTTIYELAYLGVPTIVMSNYREDAIDERELEKLGCVVPLGFHANLSDADIRDSIDALWRNGEKRASMSKKGLEVIDGQGAKRIAEKAKGLIARSGPSYQRQ